MARAKKKCAPKRKRAKRNPVVAVFGNPPRELIGKRVLEIRYVHAEDGQNYRHPFTRKDVKMYGLKDGSILIRCAGARLFEDF